MIDPLERIGAMISRRFGLLPGPCGEAGALATVVDERRLPRGLTREDYAAFVLADTDEQWELAAAMSNGWTWFFRERRQLETLVTRLASMEKREEALQVWVAGCSTGEEAYGLAMLCAERGLKVRITASDLSRSRLEAASRAIYDEHTVRSVSPEERARWLEPVPPHAFRVREELRHLVELRLHNLMDAPPAHRRFDAVVCRNVLIHATQEGALQMVRGLSQALAPGGELVLGPSDLMQVPAARASSRPPPTLGPPPSLARASTERVDAVALVTLGNLCVEAHAFDQAETAYRRAEDLDPCSPELHLAWGVLHRKRGDLERAAASLRRAVFLDETLWPAWALLAGALARLGARSESLRAAEQARLARLERPWPAWRSHTGRLLLEQLDSELEATDGIRAPRESERSAGTDLRGGD